MPLYRVVWEIDVDAETAEEAADFAKNVQLDPKSEANFFTVTDEHKNTVQLQIIDTEDNPTIH